MGKTKIVKEKTEEAASPKVEAKAKTPRKKITSGVVYVDATFNNTKVLFADKVGNTLLWSTAGADVVVRGVGSGREPAIRSLIAHGIEITSIKDRTPVPHNGPKPKKPRRV